MSDVLLQYLREARATEAGLTQTLQVHIAATPPGEHRERLERHLDTTRSHEQALAARIKELDRGEDPLQQALSLVSAPLGVGLGVARGAARTMLSLIGLPLSLVRGPGPSAADRVLRNVRAEAASSALEAATYTAIERLAEVAGDEETARLAAQLRRDEEEMLDYLRGAVVDLSDRVAGRSPGTERPQTTGHRPQSGNGGAPAPRTPDLGAPTSVAEPVHVSEEPELVAEFAEPGAEEEAGAEVEVAEPWEGYDRMKAAEIEQRLADASDELAAVVRLYESASKNRQTVLRAAERRLRLG